MVAPDPPNVQPDDTISFQTHESHLTDAGGTAATNPNRMSYQSEVADSGDSRIYPPHTDSEDAGTTDEHKNRSFASLKNSVSSAVSAVKRAARSPRELFRPRKEKQWTEMPAGHYKAVKFMPNPTEGP
jgi:hypothetical protein